MVLTGGGKGPEAAEVEAPVGTGWVYQVAPHVPAGWRPLTVVPRAGSVQIDLRVGRFEGQGPPVSEVLRELEGVRLSEDHLHLPQVVTRRWQLARMPDGSRVLWLGRERHSTREAVSERPLVYDTVRWVHEELQ